MTFDPDKWVTSLMRSLKAYMTTELGLTGGARDPYEIIQSYPASSELARKMPLTKTLIHFEIEDPRQVFFGFGDNIVGGVYDDTPGAEVSEDWEAHCHDVILNVGVWASVESGGVSARMSAREDLDRMLNGPAARERMLSATNGIEILEFTGGLFVADEINDIPVFRVVDMRLRLRVFSRSKSGPIPIWTDIDQSPGLTITDEVIIG